MNKFTKFFAVVAAAFAFVACGEPETPSQPDTNVVTVEAEPTVRIEQDLAFVVKFNGEDVTADATIYNAENNEVVSNPFTAPAEICTLSFYAVYGLYESAPITVEVVTGNDFNHRILLVDHTGTGCPNCPKMMNMLHALAETAYHLRYNEAIVHTYNGNDPAGSDDAYVVRKHYTAVTGYPNLTYNFEHEVVTSASPTPKTGVGWIKAQIDALWKPAADAGIKIETSAAGNEITVNAEVTSKVEQQYHIAAWLLEDNIYGRQSGASEDWHNYHNNALRAISSGNEEDLSGEDLGVIAVDGVAQKQIKFTADSSWVVANMKVLVIVSAPSSAHGGKYEVVNTAICPVGSTKDYEYR